MKNILTLVIMLLINIGLSGQVISFVLESDSNGIVFNVCETDYDTVVVYKVITDGICGFGNQDVGYFIQDSIIITPETQGEYEYASYDMIYFTVIFSIEPTEPFASEELYKCSETSIEIFGQTEDLTNFTYLWGNDETTPSIDVSSPGMVYVTVTGACGEVTDMVELINWSDPEPELGDNILICDGTTVILDPGEFTDYEWSDGSNDTMLEVTTADTYAVTVTDYNGCQATDNVTVNFTTNLGQEILIITIDTISGNNRVTWEVTSDAFELVKIYREFSSNVYNQVGVNEYQVGSWTDEISSTNQSWKYKISIIDTCGNDSEMSTYHQSISSTTVPIEGGGYRVEWTPYLIEGNTSVASYYIFASEGLSINWNLTELAQVTGNVTEYDLPEIGEALFVVGAELPGKTDISNLALSNVISNPFVSDELYSTANFNIFPNPATEKFEILTSLSEFKLELINTFGQIVIKQSNCSIIDISELAAGSYVVRVMFGEQITYRKLIIK